MTNIEDRLTSAADRLRHEIDETVDVDAAFAEAGEPRPPLPESPGSRWPLLLAAAAVLACVAAAGIVLSGNNDDEQFVASEGAPSTAEPDVSPQPPDADVRFDLLAETDRDDEREAGVLVFAGSSDALNIPWAVAGTGDPVPTVDFDEQFVLGFTRVRATSCGEDLTALELDGTVVSTVFTPVAAGVDCDADHVTRAFLVAVDRAEVPARFTLVLEAAADGSYDEQRLEVDLEADNAQSRPPVRDPLETAPQGPDLLAPEDGAEITFSSVAGVSIGEVLDPSEVSLHDPSGPCGYWGPGEPSHDGDEPLSGISSSIDPAAPTAETIMVRNPRFRTASGVGIGTTLASLERIYPDLVVDRADGWESPTDGLLASYQDVAAVRNGDFALTFYLRDDVVDTVKVSAATSWGDDEGCA